MKRKFYWLGVPLLATALAASWWLGAASSNRADGDVADAAQAMRQRDAEFAAGVALIEQRQYPQALSHFQGMVVRYPDLIEAHNNLAHVHATLGDVPAARAALEAGVQAQPSVRALVENLRQLHARESLLSLNKALQLERQPVPELALTPVEVVHATLAGRLVATPEAEPRAVPQEPALPSAAAVAVPVASTKEAGKPEREASTERQAAAAVRPVPPAPVVAATAAQPANGPTDQAKADEPSAEQAVLAQVRAWARAWSAPNVPQYLSFYDDSFVPPNRLTRRAWEAERQSRIAGRSISVRLENIVVTLQGERAVVRFRQHYRSGGFASSVNKRLVWVRRGAQWRIASEGVA